MGCNTQSLALCEPARNHSLNRVDEPTEEHIEEGRARNVLARSSETNEDVFALWFGTLNRADNHLAQGEHDTT